MTNLTTQQEINTALRNDQPRVLTALAETKRLLARELNHSEHLRDNDLVSFYNNHINYLNSLI